MRRRFKSGEFVFVQDMSDLFAACVPEEIINEVLKVISSQPDVNFLLLTKNPARYIDFDLPRNTVAGATIETDIQTHLDEATKAPTYTSRLTAMTFLKRSVRHKTMLSIEPVMQFSGDFLSEIVVMKPDFIAIGYDNYNHGLTEPPLKHAEGLAQGLEDLKFKVYRKTMREKHE